MFSMGSGALREEGSSGPAFNPFRFLRRVAVLAFALIQGVLIARILLDLGIIPDGNGFATFVTVWSDTLAAPVQGLGSQFGWFAGGGLPTGLPGGLPPGIPGVPGMPGTDVLGATDTGLNTMMVVALAGWTVVEWLVMRFVNKLQAI